MARKRNSDIVTTPWWSRLALYVIVAAVGLVLTFLGLVAPGQVDAWLGQVGNLSALVGGLLAAVNVTKDEKVEGVAESSPLPAPQPAPAPSPGNDLLAQLRDRIAQNRGATTGG